MTLSRPDAVTLFKGPTDTCRADSDELPACKSQIGIKTGVKNYELIQTRTEMNHTFSAKEYRRRAYERPSTSFLKNIFQINSLLSLVSGNTDK